MALDSSKAISDELPGILSPCCRHSALTNAHHKLSTPPHCRLWQYCHVTPCTFFVRLQGKAPNRKSGCYTLYCKRSSALILSSNSRQKAEPASWPRAGHAGDGTSESTRLALLWRNLVWRRTHHTGHGTISVHGSPCLSHSTNYCGAVAGRRAEKRH